MNETPPSLFSTYNISLSQAYALPLKDHPQLQLIIDILGRQHHHHILLTNCIAKKIQTAIISSLQQHFVTNRIPKTLQNTHLIYFDIARLELAAEPLKKMEQDFQALCKEASAKNQTIIFIMNQIEFLFGQGDKIPLSYLGKLLKSMLANPQWRFVIVTPDKPKSFLHLADFFSPITFIEPAKPEKIAVLRSWRAELEEFHQVTLLDEVFSAALEMANDYLPDGSSLDTSFELLDSAAARASASETTHFTEHKPIVTTSHLAWVLASRTSISLAHFKSPYFEIAKFIEALQQRIFGHDTAIQAIGSLLQTASLKLHSRPGPCCSFLFAGPASSGKTTLAKAIADYLFGHDNAFLHVHFTALPCSLNQLKVTVENCCLDLLAAVDQKPYAVLFFENMNQCAPELIESFKSILTCGYVFNSENKKISFQHTIIIMTTTVGSDCIINLTRAAPEKNKTLDLLQLVFNESVRDIIHHTSEQVSLSELRDEITGTLAAQFSSNFLQYVHIIPFVSLSYSSLEKIMQAKIKILTKHLLARFNVELIYTPEVIKFLAQEALWQQSNIKSLDNWLEQQLHSRIIHEILAHPEKKGESNQLLLRLNESGQPLRCEFVTSDETASYNL